MKWLSISVFLCASFLQSAFYWLLTIHVSRQYGVTILGEFSYALAIVSPIIVMANLQLKSYYLSHPGKINVGNILWLRLSSLGLALAIPSLLFSLVEPWILSVYVMIFFLRTGEQWSELSQLLWQSEGELGKVNLSLFTRYIILLMILTFGYQEKIQFHELIVTLAISSLGIGIADHLIGPLKTVSLKIKGSQKILKDTLFLSTSSLMTALLINIPRYFLKEFHSLETLGQFSVLFYFYVIPIMVINFVCQALLKDFSEIFSNRKSLSPLILGIILLGIIYALILEFLGEEITNTLYGHLYTLDKNVPIIIALLFIAGGIASVFHYLLLALGNYQIQLKTNIVSSAITLIFSWCLIPSLGQQGAFFSFLCGLLVQSMSYAYVFYKRKR